ncbi:MAG: MoaD/ThiS family protein [Lentisphaeria bacterium]|nr:MoaD/ThiS family protein [Lentisphaeria bacterium]NQZ68484.1 MoaD/ThiS family protein [Lentisphaeria bacterium]
MKIQFTFTSQLAISAGTSSSEVTIENETRLVDLAKKLSESYDSKFSEILFNDDGFSSSIMVVIDGNQVHDKNAIVLNADTDVMFISPMAGG